MKISKILLSSIAFVVVNSALVFAITPQEMTSEDYIINHGHSEEMARIVNLKKRQVAGKERFEEKEKGFVPATRRLLKRFHSYLDPAVDDGDFGDRKVKFDPYDL